MFDDRGGILALLGDQRLEALGQLTGGVAHDFNNLLTVIRASVDLLRRPHLPEERRLHYIDAISDTVSRAAKLTGQLLAFARRQTLKPEVFDVNQSVHTLGEMIGTLTGVNDVQTITVTANNVSGPGAGTLPSVSTQVGCLVGDVADGRLDVLRGRRGVLAGHDQVAARDVDVVLQEDRHRLGGLYTNSHLLDRGCCRWQVTE